MNGLIPLAVFALFAILIARVAEQQRALQREIKILQGFLPICSYCKSIRTDQGR